MLAPLSHGWLTTEANRLPVVLRTIRLTLVGYV